MIRAKLSYDVGLMNALRKVYGSEVEAFLNSLSTPPSRYYVRVNTLRATVDEVINRLRNRGIDVYRDEHIHEAIYFPVKGPYDVPTSNKVVVADKRAAESVMLGADLYIPGVLGGNFSKGSEVNVITPYGDIVAYGISLIDYDELRKKPNGIAVKVIKSVYEVVKIRELTEYSEGLIYPQSLPSMLVGRLMNPLDSEVIVDACAAPGGKTGHLIELSNGRATIYAFDHSVSKVKDMLHELNRLGHSGLVKVFRADSRYIHVDFPWLKADKVLIDPPCSSLGVIPKLADSKRYEDILTLARYQIQFIRSAINIVKPGGLIAYSTCTVTFEENEEVISKAINEFKLEIVEPTIKLGSKGIGTQFDEYLIRFHPHIHRQPGYFIALLRKRFSH